jgi:endonuclease/exonuclease/phosphatase family metal-dependent hydrolase
LGFYSHFAKAIDFGENNPYGIALVSRYPILSAEVIFIPDPEVRKYDGYYETRVLLKATIDVGGGLNVLVSHFGLNPDEHENAVQTVISNLPENRCVLMGDFNMEPDNPILDPIMRRLYDTAQNFSSPKLSFPSDTPTVKIDYIFVSKDLKVQYADIPEIVSSDHRPHIATIEFE